MLYEKLKYQINWCIKEIQCFAKKILEFQNIIDNLSEDYDGLTDTPVNKVGSARKVPTVDSTESNHEYTFIPDALIESNSLTTEEVNNYPIGTNLNDKTIKNLVLNIYAPTKSPTFTNPSFSLSKSASTLQKINASINFNLTFNFNRGQIIGALVGGVWNVSAIQDYRTGAVDYYSIDGIQQVSNVLNVTKVISQGYNTYLATVTYLEGPQPTNSDGNNYSTPYPAGTSPSQSTTIEGVYPLYASTSNIATGTEQSLVSMITANNIEKTLVAESGGNKQFFDIPDAWLSDRPLTSVQYYNTVSESFDTTNKISDFTTSAITHTVEGLSVNYTRYTNIAPNRGELTIKLIF